MKKILIISYFFPPCELTAGRRVESWARELASMGYDVSVITRKWEHPVKSFDDIHLPTSAEIKHDQLDGYKISYVPYQPNLRDRLINSNRSIALRKILTTKELLMQNINLSSCPFSNLYDEARTVCQKENIDLVIISGNPFIQFKFGYLLNKEFGIPWIADYRDAWTTSSINAIGRSLFYSIYQAYDRIFEKKWVKTASLITASSEEIGTSVSEITGVRPKAIYNGYDKDLFNGLDNVQKKKEYFQITYVGTLYQGQDISVFLRGYKKFIESINPKSKLLFPGLAADRAQLKRVEQEMEGFTDFFEATERIPHDQILRIEKESHLLLHVAWKGHKGIIASKIYEYFGSGTKILIAPGDDGAIDHLVQSAKAGEIINNDNDVTTFLLNEYDNFKKDQIKSYSEENKLLHKFTRQSQAKELEKEIKKLI